MKKSLSIIALTGMLVLNLCACGKGTADIKTVDDIMETAADSTSTASGSPEERDTYIQPEMKGDLSINVYESSEWLETAVAMFVKKYPDMNITIKDFYNGKDVNIYTGDGVTTSGVRPTGQTRDDYVAQLNTQLLSGEADDIIITSIGLPIGRYIKMGVFEDLSKYLDSSKEINEEEYYMNIFDACRTEEGALYQFPISATAIPLVQFDHELIEHTGIGPDPKATAVTWREALDIGKKMFDKSELPNTYMNDVRTVIGNIFTKSAIAAINYDTGKIEIDRDKMLQLLNVKEELKGYKIVPEGFDFYSNEYHLPYGISYQADVEAAAAMLANEAQETLQWKYDDGKVYLSPYYALDFGITGKSESKGQAWEFLKFLVSEEVQTLPSCPNAGVNKKGLAQRVEGSMATMGGFSQTDVDTAKACIDGWVSQINAYRSEDTELIQITEGVLQEYLDGSQTAEATIDKLISRLEQYMNE